MSTNPWITSITNKDQYKNIKKIKKKPKNKKQILQSFLNSYTGELNFNKFPIYESSHSPYMAYLDFNEMYRIVEQSRLTKAFGATYIETPLEIEENPENDYREVRVSSFLPYQWRSTDNSTFILSPKLTDKLLFQMICAKYNLWISAIDFTLLNKTTNEVINLKKLLQIIKKLNKTTQDTLSGLHRIEESLVKLIHTEQTKLASKDAKLILTISTDPLDEMLSSNWISSDSKRTWQSCHAIEFYKKKLCAYQGGRIPWVLFAISDQTLVVTIKRENTLNIIQRLRLIVDHEDKLIIWTNTYPRNGSSISKPIKDAVEKVLRKKLPEYNYKAIKEINVKAYTRGPYIKTNFTLSPFKDSIYRGDGYGKTLITTKTKTYKSVFKGWGYV